MTTEKICPIMSRPLQGPNSAFKDEADMVEQNWYPVNGVAWENVFPCIREKCMAWVPEKKESLLKDPDCPGAMENPFIEITAVGYCSLIEKAERISKGVGIK